MLHLLIFMQMSKRYKKYLLCKSVATILSRTLNKKVNQKHLAVNLKNEVPLSCYGCHPYGNLDSGKNSLKLLLSFGT